MTTYMDQIVETLHVPNKEEVTKKLKLFINNNPSFMISSVVYLPSYTRDENITLSVIADIKPWLNRIALSE